MASGLVNHILSPLKKLIVRYAEPKTVSAALADEMANTERASVSGMVNEDVAEAAPMKTATVSVHEMLFGAPVELELDGCLGDSAVCLPKSELCATKVDLVSAATAMVTVKEEPMESNDEGISIAIGHATGVKEESIDSNDEGISVTIGHARGASEVINADEASSVMQDVLLVFPFLGGDNIEKASVGLPLCNTGDTFSCSQLITYQLEKSVGRNHSKQLHSLIAIPFTQRNLSTM